MRFNHHGKYYGKYIHRNTVKPHGEALNLTLSGSIVITFRQRISKCSVSSTMTTEIFAYIHLLPPARDDPVRIQKSSTDLSSSVIAHF